MRAVAEETLLMSRGRRETVGMWRCLGAGEFDHDSSDLRHCVGSRMSSELCLRILPATIARGSLKKACVSAGSDEQCLHQIRHARSSRDSPPCPLAEQEAIAEALSDADALIESLEQLIAKKRQLKQGAMQDCSPVRGACRGSRGVGTEAGWGICSRSRMAGTKQRSLRIGIPIVNYMDVFSGSAHLPESSRRGACRSVLRSSNRFDVRNRGRSLRLGCVLRLDRTSGLLRVVCR